MVFFYILILQTKSVNAILKSTQMWGSVGSRGLENPWPRHSLRRGVERGADAKRRLQGLWSACEASNRRDFLWNITSEVILWSPRFFTLKVDSFSMSSWREIVVHSPSRKSGKGRLLNNQATTARGWKLSHSPRGEFHRISRNCIHSYIVYRATRSLQH